MEEQRFNQQDVEGDITLKELILKIQEYFFEVLKNWKLVVLITTAFIILLTTITYITPVTFPAPLTFMLDEDEGGGMGALGGLATSFGFGDVGEYNLEKMHSLLKSRRIVEQTLFEKGTIDGKSDFYSNHMIRIYKFHEIWEEDTTGLQNFHFTHRDFENFEVFENKALKQLYGLLVGNASEGVDGILFTEIDEETGIMNMSVHSTSEMLSIKLVKSLYQNLSKFYIDKSTEKQRQTFVVTKLKVDSFRTALNSAQYKLLNIRDSQRSLTLKRFQSEELKLEREVRTLALIYAEALKNQEIADFSLKNKTPFIQSIDTPIPPIKPSKDLISYIKNIIIGGIIGGFLSVLFIVARKIIRDAMSYNLEN